MLGSRNSLDAQYGFRRRPCVAIDDDVSSLAALTPSLDDAHLVQNLGVESLDSGAAIGDRNRLVRIVVLSQLALGFRDELILEQPRGKGHSLIDFDVPVANPAAVNGFSKDVSRKVSWPVGLAGMISSSGGKIGLWLRATRR